MTDSIGINGWPLILICGSSKLGIVSGNKLSNVFKTVKILIGG